MAQGLIGTFESLMIAHRASTGYYMGTQTAPNSVANGTTTSGYLYNKPVDMETLALDYATRSGKGGGKVWTQKVAGVSAINNSPLNLSAFDTVLEGYIKGYTPDASTNSNYIVGIRNEQKTAIPNFGLIGHMQLDYEDGSSKFLNVIKLNVQITQTSGTKLGNGDGENPSPLAYEIVHAQSSKNVFGQNFASANARPTDDIGYEMWIIGEYKLGITTYVDDGAATSYILGYRPSSATKGLHFIFKNGVENSAAVTAISATTGVVSGVTPGTAGAVWHHLYPTAFVAI